MEIIGEAVTWAIVLGALFALATYLERREARSRLSPRCGQDQLMPVDPVRHVLILPTRHVAPDVRTTTPYDWSNE